MKTIDGVPSVADEPIIRCFYSEEAKALYKAEERYLDSAIPEVLALLGSELTNEELANHPLLMMYLNHCSRRWEDSLR